MKVLLELPDDVRSLPLEKQKEEVLRAYQALQPEKESKNRPMEPKKSKWSRIVEEIENDRTLDLKGYSVYLQKNMQEFRENFTFSHDQ